MTGCVIAGYARCMSVKNKMTLRDAVSLYLKRVSVHKKGHQQERYRVVPILNHDIADMWMHDITTVEIAIYRDYRLSSNARYSDRKLSSNTVRLELALLSDLFSIAHIEWGACTDNPVIRVRKPKLPPGRDRRLRPREEAKLLRRASEMKNPEMYSVIVIALETAMRQGEILGIQWEDINLRIGIVHLRMTKNGTKRDVPLTFRAREAFTRLGVKPYGPVFSYKQTGFKSMWRALLAKVNITDLHFHDLRHEAISRMFELGTMDVVEISTISGHKSIQMLKRYTHLKAHKLVAKLEKTRKRARKQLLGFSAYPAIIMDDQLNGKITVDFIDFDELIIQSNIQDKSAILRRAKDVLLRELANKIRDNKALPIPSDMEDICIQVEGQGYAVLIDPL